MIIGNNKYVPILKWRQGEYMALERLQKDIKEAVFPLITIPPVEYDFEESKPKKTVQEHIETFPTRFFSKWGRHAFIEVHESLKDKKMSDGNFVINYIFNHLRAKNSSAVPVLSLADSSAYMGLIKNIVNSDGRGLALRVKLTELMSPSLNGLIAKIISQFLIPNSKMDLIVDLGEPESFEPYNEFAAALSHAIQMINNLTNFRSFVITGMSLKLDQVKKPGAEKTRHEWFLYHHLVQELQGIRVPTYGDYTIESPGYFDQDMRLLKPAGKIIYATDTSWIIPKGGQFRKNEAQMVGHCSIIVNSGHYCNPTYSHGDKRIHDTLHKVEGTGNLATWKQVGVSHHITKVVNQLSNFHAS